MQGLHPKPYLGTAKFLSVAPVSMCQQSFSVRAEVLTAEESGLLGHYLVSLGKWFPTFQCNKVSSDSSFKHQDK